MGYLVVTLIVNLIILTVSLLLSIYLVRAWIMPNKKISQKVTAIILLVVIISTSCYIIVPRIVKVELVAELTVTNRLIPENAEPSWQGIYGEIDGKSEAYYFFAGCVGYDYMKNIELPELDLDNYTYALSFGRKINFITYYVWDTLGGMYRYDTKSGYPVFCGDFHNDKVYLYRLKKMRIDHPGI